MENEYQEDGYGEIRVPDNAELRASGRRITRVRGTVRQGQQVFEVQRRQLPDGQIEVTTIMATCAGCHQVFRSNQTIGGACSICGAVLCVSCLGMRCRLCKKLVCAAHARYKPIDFAPPYLCQHCDRLLTGY